MSVWFMCVPQRMCVVCVLVCVCVCVCVFRFLPSIEWRLALKVVEVIADSSQSCTRSLPLRYQSENKR